MRNLYTFSQLVLRGRPVAQAQIQGAGCAPKLSGTVQFYRAGEGTQVVAELMGLPSAVRVGGEKQPSGPFYAFHIYQDGPGDSFGSEGAGREPGLPYNPHGAPHPHRAGDLPPLLASGGYAYMSFYTGRFTPEQVVGMLAVVRQRPDDFRTQPDGDGGVGIGWGEILELA